MGSVCSSELYYHCFTSNISIHVHIFHTVLFLSNAVLMYRSCGAFRQWSDVDLSACTLQAANPDPVLFYWFLMFTPEPAPDTDTADELNSFSDAIRNDVSFN